MFEGVAGTRSSNLPARTDYVFPRHRNKILRAFLLAKGIPADPLREYTPFNLRTTDDRRQIKRFSSRQCRVLSTIRRQQRSLLQGILQPGPAQRECADHGLQRGRGLPARHGHPQSHPLGGSSQRGTTTSRWTRAEKESPGLQAYAKKTNLPAATSA